MTSLTQDIPLGDLQIYDNYVPALEAGNWRIEVSHTLDGIATGPLGATQEFVVSAPQFAVDPAAVLSRYPPDGSTGRFGQVLPHVVLQDAMLPWERKLTGSANAQPWLALLVLEEEELIGATDNPTRVNSASVAEFMAIAPPILKPGLTQEDDVLGTDRCVYIELSTATFTALTPRLEELRYLAHCRQSNIADKAALGLDNGLFSIVVSNRLPPEPTTGATQPRKSIVHLVSMEGLEPYLTDQPNFAGCTSVALLSLASWTFLTMADRQQDFRGLMEAIVAQEYDGTSYQPEALWLRLPAPDPAIDTSTAAGLEASQRVAAGYVPLQYQLRSGEQTFGWYRGPLTPALPEPLAAPDAFLTADSALIYQPGFGMFDGSLAAAWEIGRALALSDRHFGQLLFEFRNRGHKLTDALFHRLQSDSFTATQIADLSADTRIQDEFLQILNTDLLADIGKPVQPGPPPPPPPPPPSGPDPDPQTALQNFLADPDVTAAVVGAVADDLDPIATWLARLRLLYNVPFNMLVPDARMLAMETLKFFYVDGNWLRCLHDGAVSIGMESSRTTFFHEMTKDLLFDAAIEATQVYRAQLIGADPPTPPPGEDLIGGFMLRSAVVSGWPNLAVRGGKNDGTYLKILRMDHLAPNLLFCLFLGVPDFVELSEPQEGFRFGVDDDGNIPLRQPTASGTALGKQLGKTLQVVPSCLRSADSNVFDLGSSAGLVAAISQALTKANLPVSPFGPADFALQMVKSPEAIRFTSQTA
jgi:hypothetical protein